MNYCYPAKFKIVKRCCLDFTDTPQSILKIPTKDVPEKVLFSASNHLMVSPHDIVNSGRQTTIADARFMCISLIHKYAPKMTLKEIGNCFNGRHYSTIIYALNQANNLIETDKKFRADYNAIKSNLLAGISTKNR